MNLRSPNEKALPKPDNNEDFNQEVRQWETTKNKASGKGNETLPTSEELKDTSKYIELKFADMQKLRLYFSHDIFYVEHPDIIHDPELGNVFSEVKKVRIDHFTKNMEGMDVLHGNVINDLNDSFTFTSAEVDNPIQNMFYMRIKPSSGGKTRKLRKHRKTTRRSRKKKNSRKSAKKRRR